MTDNDTHKATDLTYTFDVSSGTIYSDGDEYTVFSENVTLNANADSDVERVLPNDLDTEYEGSLTVDIEVDTVVCPNCNTAVSVPTEPFLSLTRDPVPCHECGYPLL